MPETRLETSCWGPTQYTSTSLIHFDACATGQHWSKDMEKEQNKEGTEYLHKLNENCSMCTKQHLRKDMETEPNKEAAEQLHI